MTNTAKDSIKIIDEINNPSNTSFAAENNELLGIFAFFQTMMISFT